MKRTFYSIFIMVALAGLAVWIFEGAGLATHVNPNAGYSPSNETGHAGDHIDDDTPSRTGFDRSQDRSPDSTPDKTQDATPDCGDGPGDGQCGNTTENGGSDGTPDHPGGPGEGDELGGNGDSVPDQFAVQGYNRVGDNVRDDTPDVPMYGSYSQDQTPDRVGRSMSSSDEGAVGAGDGTFDRVAAEIIASSDNPRRPNRDGDGHGSDGSVTPDQVTPANEDGTSDGVQDRNLTGDLRDTGRLNHSQASRDAFDKGPGDRTKDSYLGTSGDRGGFGFAPVTSGGGGGGGGGYGGGCSTTGYTSIDTMGAVSYLLVLLSPIALVQLRRLVRRK